MRHRLDAAIDAHRDRGTAVLAAEADR